MQPSPEFASRKRLRYLWICIVVLGAITALRLGQLQLFQHGYYSALAAGEHHRKYEVPASRGQIYLQDDGTKVPLALNQTLKLVYADPSIITDKDRTAAKLAAATAEPIQTYKEALSKGGEYVVLKAKVNEEMASRIKALNLRGVGLVNRDYRTYPEGTLASQVLGFVNTEGEGQYGVEGYLNKELKGQPGLLNAKTDTNGVPIVTTDNLSKPPVDGTDLVLTLDRNVQAQAERFLKEGVENVRAESGSVIVIDPKTGAVKAMANYPTFDPNGYQNVRDYRLFSNAVVTNQFEPGSGFKAITMAAGLDSGKIRPETTYNDTGCEKIANYDICNAANHKGGPNTDMTVVLRDSLNTGVMFVLRALGGDTSKITPLAKQVFHTYITDRFGFGSKTGIEQAGEAAGKINPPTSNDVNYANMSFGQGESVTMLQMAAAIGAIANKGTLYKPYLVAERLLPDGSIQKAHPIASKKDVISRQAALELSEMMKVVVERGSGYLAKTPGYSIAGKTGTAQIPNPDGPGYLPDKNIGTFVGFAPVEDPKFVVMVRINKPHYAGYAERTTVPVFANLTRWLLRYHAVPPSS